jgi:glycosyltransferase involved in cell wall biosynthesis
VLLEAMACGIPVAAYPVTGPIDVVVDGVTGVLRDDLKVAALASLQLDPEACRAHALRYSWEASSREFLAGLAVVTAPAPAAPVPAT